jgi:NADH-quinone oxidoreductase subunit L
MGSLIVVLVLLVLAIGYSAAKGKKPGLASCTALAVLIAGMGIGWTVSLTAQVWLIILIPLFSFWVQMFLGRKHMPRQGDWFAIGAIGLSFVLSFLIYKQAIAAYQSGEAFLHQIGQFDWIAFTQESGQRVPWRIGFWVDSLTAVMLMVVCIVSLLVHIFSVGYMKGEENYSRYFGYLGLFSFSMLLLVLTDNLFVLYCSWELVGVSSFLLIGFFINKDSAAAAAKKAFLTNRVGDIGFAIGLYLIYSNLHTFSFSEIFEKVAAGELAGWKLTATSLALFCGAVGKSAQFPLHIWLPDAMEGPTPVSALIHAATMVAAGVYQVARLYPVYSDTALLVVAYVGAFTALGAATIAITQFDIKRVLAYSTLSQLGYMMAALGVGAYTAGMFHLTTHAFFKALLFLCSGSVIMAMHHEQDMRKMGGLAKKIPITFLCMAIGTIAISGVPFFSGFYSKDMILAGALEKAMENPHHALIFLALLLAAGITAFYMFRLLFMTFTGKPRDEHAYDHAKESPAAMVVPLLLLAFLAIGSGYEDAGLGGFFKDRVVPYGTQAEPDSHDSHAAARPGLLVTVAQAQEEHAAESHPATPTETLSPAAGVHAELGHEAPGDDSRWEHSEGHHHGAHEIAMVLSILIAFTGIFLSALTYWERVRLIDPDKASAAMGKVYGLVYDKYRVDEFYARVFYKPLERLRNVLAAFDLKWIDGLVNGSATVTVKASNRSGRFDLNYVDRLVNWLAEVFQAWGERVRHIETGVIQNYVLKTGSAFGVIVVMWMVVKSYMAGS